MVGAHRRRRHRTVAVSAWLGAGAATVGIGATLVSGAALAQAQPTDSTGHSTSGASHHASHAGTKSTTSSGKHAKASPAKTTDTGHAGSHSHSHLTVTPKPAATAEPTTAATGTEHRALVSTPATTAKLESKAAPPIAAVPGPAASADATSGSGSVAAVIEKTTRRTTASQSSTGTTTSNNSADNSAPLSALAAVSQLASTPVDNDGSNSSSAAGTASSSAAGTAAKTSWLTGQTATPGASVKVALQEISQAQKAVGNNLVPQIYLAVAKWALSTWQGTNAGAIAYYAMNSTGLVGAFTKFALDINEALPGLAQVALYGAESMTSAGSATRTLIDQAAQDGKVYGSVQLTMYQNTEPIIEISINGGPKVKVLVDTGSSGLVINSDSIGTASSLGNAVGSGTSGYSGGLTYAFHEYNTTVDFGNGIVTGLTTVDVVTADTEAAYEKYISVNGVVGVLGIGANAVGPGPSLVTSALPGELKDGIFIDEAAGVLQFGPNPRPVRAAVSGSPNATGVVEVPVLGVRSPINLLIDSGGVYGTIPSTVWTAVGETQVPGGMKISVYSADGSTLLYSYTTTNTNAPVVTTDAAESQQLNTGYTPFANNAMYIAYTTTVGETDFDL